MPDAVKARKPAKFSGRAKALTTATAVTALIGGWSWIGHIEEAKAKAASPQPTTTVSVPRRAIALPTLHPLNIAPIATLVPERDLPFDIAVTDGNAVTGSSVTLQPIPALAALPTLAPLPALPVMPDIPPPVIDSGSGQGGGSNSGDSTSASSGSQSSGGS